jgi:Kyanoviridae exonuclease
MKPDRFNHTPTHLGTPLMDTTYPSGVRIYRHTDGSKFPSITTCLQDFKKDIIEKWRNRIGEQAADKILKDAIDRGNAIHEMAERYLKNEDPAFLLQFQPKYRNLFGSVRLKLNRYVNNIRVQEKPLFSRKLKVAGRCDLIADWDGKLSVIDFKGSGQIKKEDWIENYFIQITFYALAYYEMTGIPINQGVIVMANDGSKAAERNQYDRTDLGNTVKVFTVNVKDFIKPLIREIKTFYRNHDIDTLQ